MDANVNRQDGKVKQESVKQAEEAQQRPKARVGKSVERITTSHEIPICEKVTIKKTQ